MESTLISGIQLGSIIEIEYTINDDGEGPSASDPSIFKIWWEANMFLTTGKHYTQERVGRFKSIFPTFKIAFKPMSHMGYDDESVEEVSFLSETLGIAIESGYLFWYRKPSKKQFTCYKFDSDVSSHDREVIYSPKTTMSH